MATGALAYLVGPDFPSQGPTSQVERALANRIAATRAQPVIGESGAPRPDFPGYTARLQRWASPIQRRQQQVSNVPGSPLQLAGSTALPGPRGGSTSSGKVTIGNSLWVTAATRLPWLPA